MGRDWKMCDASLRYVASSAICFESRLKLTVGYHHPGFVVSVAGLLASDSDFDKALSEGRLVDKIFRQYQEQ